MKRPAEPASDGPLRFAVPTALEDQLLLPDLLEPVTEAVASFVAEIGREVRIECLGPRPYELEVRAAFSEGSPPDLVWLPATLGWPLGEAGHLLPLEPWLVEHPQVLDGLQRWMERLYWHKGHCYAVPVGEKGNQCGLGYAVPAVAAERGTAHLAQALIAHLRARVPLRGLPDLALDAVEIADVRMPGDEIVTGAVYSAVVRNLGDERAEDVHVVLESEGLGVLADFRIPSIEAGKDQPMRAALGDPEPGLYWLRCVLDGENAVPELNRANNASAIPWYSKFSGPGGAPSVVKAQSAPIAIDAAAYQSSVNGMHPRVAFDGTNYLVVWANQPTLSQTSYGHKLLAVRVSPSGAVLDSTPLTVASKITKYDNFDVCFGATNYLVAWEEDNWSGDPLSSVYAARVSTSGSVLDTTPITIENSAHATRTFHHEWPRVHFDGANFVVTYRTVINTLGDCSDPGVSCGIYARRVSPSGSLLSGKTTMLPLTSSFLSYATMDTVFHAGGGLIVLVGQSTPTNQSGVFGQWFSSSGGAPVPSAGGPVGIATSTGWPTLFDWPCAARHGTNAYVAVWARNLTTPPATVKYQTGVATLGAAGSTPSAKGSIPTTNGDEHPAVAWDGSAYTIVTRHHVGCHSYLGTARMAPSGTYGPATYFQDNDLVGAVDIAFGTTNGLVVFEDFNPPSSPNGPDWSWGVHARLIDKSQ